MKTNRSLSKSVTASLRTAMCASAQIDVILTEIKRGGYTLQEKMPKLRALLAELNQRVHEMNAYHNALTTA